MTTDTDRTNVIEVECHRPRFQNFKFRTRNKNVEIQVRQRGGTIPGEKTKEIKRFRVEMKLLIALERPRAFVYKNFPEIEGVGNDLDPVGTPVTAFSVSVGVFRFPGMFLIAPRPFFSSTFYPGSLTLSFRRRLTGF